MITAAELAQSAENDAHPPSDLSPTARCLWLARAGRWHEAHDQCQNLPDPAGSWIHAWLHREEGDYGNACYWYSRASKAAPAQDADLKSEWLEITEVLLTE